MGTSVRPWLRAALSEQLSALSGILPAHANEQSLLPLLLRLLKDPASAVRTASVEAVGAALQNTVKGAASSWLSGTLGMAVRVKFSLNPC